MTDPSSAARFSAVPPEARAGLDEVLQRAVGVAPATFAEENSAEAAVWTIFSHLLQTAGAAPCWQLLGDDAQPWPSALLWGGEALGDQAEVVRGQLIERSPSWAPDVVLEQWPAGLVFVVGRTFKPHADVHDVAAWPRWVDDTEAFVDAAAARASGRLELSRAWRLGWELAGRRRFTLVNLQLLPERAQQRAATDLFVSSLRERDDRRFRQLSWRALLGGLPRPWPAWLTRYVTARHMH